MSFPEDLLYWFWNHEWIRVDGARARVGVTERFLKGLGEVVFLELPTAGTTVFVGQHFGKVKGTRGEMDIYAPVGGVVAATNMALAADPELLNADPYGEGWLCEIEINDVAALERLADASAYRDIVEKPYLYGIE